MLISRTPLRVSFLGGGTDLPWYFEKFGGCVISMTINKHIYITGRPMFEEDTFLLRYSKLESTKNLNQIEHPIIKEVLRYFKVKSIDIGVSSDFPAGTGMGSSSAFTVGLIKLIATFTGELLTDHEIAELACKFEIDMLKEPIGKQDQYIAAFGGITEFIFHKDGSVISNPLGIATKTIHDLEDNLVLFFTGTTRSASSILKDQVDKSNLYDQKMLENLHFTKELGLRSKNALINGPKNIITTSGKNSFIEFIIVVIAE
jgi:D-glycero-alpha-D-manno-heptose-7-phosphate kinase